MKLSRPVKILLTILGVLFVAMTIVVYAKAGMDLFGHRNSVVMDGMELSFASFPFTWPDKFDEMTAEQKKFLRDAQELAGVGVFNGSKSEEAGNQILLPAPALVEIQFSGNKTELIGITDMVRLPALQPSQKADVYF